MATPEQTAALAAALRGQSPTTADMGVYGLVTAPEEDDVRMQAAAMAQALRGQRAAGNLGLLTGDRVLSGFGQAQIQGADKQEGILADAGQFRSGQVLKKALEAEEAKRQAKRDAENERHRRVMEAKPPSNVFLPGPGGQYFMGSTRGPAAVVPVADPAGAPVFSPKADDLKAAETKAETDATNKKVDLESKYRTELLGLQPVKEYQLAAIGVDKVRNAAKDPSPAGDIALVFGYMKTIDPTSAVKETEFATAQNAANVPERIRNMWERVKTGERLSPAQRQEFIASAESQFAAYENRAKPLVEGYRKLAVDQGLDPSRVILDGLMVENVAPAAPASRGPPNTVSSTTPRRAPMPAGELDGGPEGGDAAPTAEIPVVSVRGMKPGDLSKSLRDGETVQIKETGKVVRKRGDKLVVVKAKE